ncbi:GNAT family N-acetyltransferase [Blastochloris viridis]|uniref:Ribosomal-protein-S18p-alanine acetyltransferase n=1 Tax=Blastochloris viridis TaxID=1079 RepID=A0A182CYU9_BLAVI|nr:GNAT family N-acetyltransferase [Blastochloris viridis]BAR98314.1 ribosomal-protein-S18p-alanine acetyltransferase [Blastochloris viridis]
MLRDADADDCGTLADLHATGFERGWSEHEFERLLTDRHSVAHVACGTGGHGDIIGALLSRQVTGEAEILTVVVRTTERGMGVGRAMLHHHLDRLAEIGVREVFLEVAEDNDAACRLYESAGFVEVGRRKAYYARPGEAATALVLRRAVG